MKKFIAIILAIGLFGVIGYTGWYLYTQRKSPEQQQAAITPTITETTSDESPIKTIDLASNSVRFNIKKEWEVLSPGCVQDAQAYADLNYVDSVSVVPNEKLPTAYGGGTEFFTIHICVFKDAQDTPLSKWLEMPAGGLYPTDITSNDPINKYEAFYRKRVENYEEVYYLLKKDQSIVYVTARIFDPATLDDGTKVGDFRQYELPIKELVQSIQIK